MAKTEETPTTKRKPVRYENTSSAIAWLPTFTANAKGERIPGAPQLVVPGKTKHDLTDDQFQALSPEQWGVEIANEKCRLYDVPEDVEKRINDAVSKEERRLDEARRADIAVKAKREKGEEFRL